MSPLPFLLALYGGMFVLLYILWAWSHIASIIHYGKILIAYERQNNAALKTSIVSDGTPAGVFAKELPYLRRAFFQAVFNLICFRPDYRQIELRATHRHLQFEIMGLTTTFR